MTSYSSFTPLVLPFATDCPEALAEAQLRSAAIEFCQLTGVVRYDFPTVVVAANQKTATLVLPADHQVENVISAYYDDWPLLTGPDDIIARRYGVDWRTVSGTPRFVYEPGGNIVQMVPYPEKAAAKGLSVRASLRPTRTSTSCMDILYERYAEALAAGALARLYAIPGQSFTAPLLVQVRRTEFDRGVSQARQDISRGMSRTRTIARPHPGNM